MVSSDLSILRKLRDILFCIWWPAYHLLSPHSSCVDSPTSAEPTATLGETWHALSGWIQMKTLCLNLVDPLLMFTNVGFWTFNTVGDSHVKESGRPVLKWRQFMRGEVNVWVIRVSYNHHRRGPYRSFVWYSSRVIVAVNMKYSLQALGWLDLSQEPFESWAPLCLLRGCHWPPSSWGQGLLVHTALRSPPGRVYKLTPVHVLSALGLARVPYAPSAPAWRCR